MCGFGGFGGGHMFSFLFVLLLIFGAMFFFKRGGFCPNRAPEGKSDAALAEEVAGLRKEIEALKQTQKENES